MDKITGNFVDNFVKDLQQQGLAPQRVADRLIGFKAAAEFLGGLDQSAKEEVAKWEQYLDTLWERALPPVALRVDLFPAEE